MNALKSFVVSSTSVRLLLLTACCCGFTASAHQQTGDVTPRPATQATTTKLPSALIATAEPPPVGVTDIKFRELFQLPVGPRGLEPSQKLLSLDGKKVRLIGYMVNSEVPQQDTFILSPLPVSIGDEDESLSDDLPASVVFVHLQFVKNNPINIPFIPGLIKLTGVLKVGSQEERADVFPPFVCRPIQQQARHFSSFSRSVRLVTESPITQSFINNPHQEILHAHAHSV